jgi:hypothetical protein
MKIKATPRATAAIERMFGKANTKYKQPAVSVAGDLHAEGVLRYAADPRGYYFDRDAHRSFFYQSAATGESIPVMLHMCSEQYNNGSAVGGVTETLVIRRLPADGGGSEMTPHKLEVTLSDAQIEQLKNLTPYQRSKLGFSCHFSSRRVQIWSDYAMAVQSEVVFPVYTYAEFIKWVSCVDQRENPVDISGLKSE